MTKILQTPALFLLNHPPLDEIGGPITTIIEKYRFKVMTEQEAIEALIANFAPFIEKFVNENKIINEMCM